MLLEHQTPLLDDVEQSLSEGTRVHAEPLLKDDADFDRLQFLVDCLIHVDLQTAK